MDPKTRMLTAWRFEEPDCVPLEIRLNPYAKDLPGAEEIAEFEQKEAAKFCWSPLFDWGFFGLDSTCNEEVIEDVPGDFKRMLRTQYTSAGEFTAITRHLYDDLCGGDPNDYHWEKRYFETTDDLKRIAGADRRKRPFNLEKYNQSCKEIGNQGMPGTGVLHPLGTLVRNSNMTKVYMWMMTEEQIMLEYLERLTGQICDTLLAIKDKELCDPPVFLTHALEMLIPPWLGRTQFEKLVFPFDKRVNDAIHTIGGRHRAHCHGNSGGFLERFADMGIDGLEPLEPPPYGDNNLANAKNRVGDRMLLAGNIPSQAFYMDSFRAEDVRELVRRTIAEGAPGGGFFLKTTGGTIGGGKNREQKIKSIRCGRALIEAWSEFGSS